MSARGAYIRGFVNNVHAIMQWSDQALCTRFPQEADAWFSDDATVKREARRICGRCDVARECLEYALKNESYGIWGGLDNDQRRRLLLTRRSEKKSRTA